MLQRLIDHFSKGNKSQFANKLGVKPQTISTWIARDSMDKALIFAKCENISPLWLMSGEGEMLNTPSASAPKEKRGALTQTVQYFPEVEATGGHMDLYEDRKENSVSLEIPKSFDCDYALNLAGDSMAPLYNPGCIILIKRWTERFIEYGRVYLIVTKMGNRMVKYIRPASDEAYIICASENPAYPPFEVAREDILALYAVKGCIFQHSM